MVRPGFRIAMMKRFLLPTVVVLTALAVPLLPGCAPAPDVDEMVKANLMQIAKGYLMILSYNRRPPKDMEELRAAVNDLHRLDMGVPVDEALVSPRDKQPLVIVLGANSSDPGDSILAYEQEGLNGQRWIVTMGADVKQLPDAEFAKAKFPKNHKPQGT
jgi:hypothetical protein